MGIDFLLRKLVAVALVLVVVLLAVLALLVFAPEAADKVEELDDKLIKRCNSLPWTGPHKG